MKRLVLLIVLASLAFSQCSTIVSDLETAHANYVYMDAIDCSRPMSDTPYVNLAQLAEGYAYAAQCFKEEAVADKAMAYYALSAEKYLLASEALCETDYPIQMLLLMSAGDAYKSARQTELARTTYNQALMHYRQHHEEIDSSLYATTEQKLYELDHPLVDDWSDAGDKESTDWIPFAIAGLVFVGLGLVILSLKK